MALLLVIYPVIYPSTNSNLAPTLIVTPKLCSQSHQKHIWDLKIAPSKLMNKTLHINIVKYYIMIKNNTLKVSSRDNYSPICMCLSFLIVDISYNY
jgi:hypothetical protein